MVIDRGLLDKLRTRGEEVLSQLSGELMTNPGFLKAMEGAVRGREKLEQAAASALRQMNVPTRSELKRATARIEALEREVSLLRARVKARGGARPAGAAAPATPRQPSPRRKKAAAGPAE